MNNITFSKGLVDLLTQFEGVRLHPYLDGRGIPTIGIGSTRYEDGIAVTMKDPAITLERATDLLLYHVNKIELPDVQTHIKVDLKQYELDAIGCLIYNIGDGGFDKSHVLIDINSHIGGDTLKDAWESWNKSNSVVVPGLTTRRAKEYNYFLTGKI